MVLKRIGFLVLLFLCSFLLVSLSSVNASTIPLEKAINDGKVKVNITGLGGSTGDTILLKVQRKVPKTLRLKLTPGTVFKSSSGAVQNMIAAGIKGERVGPSSYRPSPEIYLNNNKEREYVVEAYCLDFHKPNPGSSDAFVISSPDERTKEIILKGKNAGYSINVIQSAIWIFRSRVTDSQLKRRFPVNDKDLKKAHELLGSIEKPRVSKLFVETDPKDARVRILNIKPKFHQGIELKFGRYHIEVSANGYETYKNWIIKSERESKLNIKLKMLSGKNSNKKSKIVTDLNDTQKADYLLKEAKRIGSLYHTSKIVFSIKNPTVVSNNKTGAWLTRIKSSPKSIADFYSKKMQEEGWSVGHSSVNDQSGQLVMVGDKGMLQIWLTNIPDENLTNCSIILSKGK